MSAQGRHAGPSADVNHFPLCGLHMEVTKRSYAGYKISRLQAEHVAGTNTGGAVLAWRRCSDPYVEAKNILGCLVTGQRVVVAPAGLGIARYQIEHVLVAPHGRKRLFDGKVTKAKFSVSGNIELQVIARCEANSPAVRRLEYQFFYKRRDIVIAYDAESIRRLRPSANTASPLYVHADARAYLLDGIRGKAAANGRARR